eukprot:1158818-Pelagomonas_calceolata.AAC.12
MEGVICASVEMQAPSIQIRLTSMLETYVLEKIITRGESTVVCQRDSRFQLSRFSVCGQSSTQLPATPTYSPHAAARHSVCVPHPRAPAAGAVGFCRGVGQAPLACPTAPSLTPTDLTGSLLDSTWSHGEAVVYDAADVQ